MSHDIKSHPSTININIFKLLNINQNPNDPDDENEHFKQSHLAIDLRLRNVNKVIIGNLNMTCLPKKVNQLREIMLKYVDVLIITKTKLYDTFLTSQFLVIGFYTLQIRPK